MDTESLQELAKARAQVDTKLLKKTIKDFYRLVNPELVGEELQAAHESFVIGLDSLAQHLHKTTRLQRVTELEVAGYVDEATAIEATSRDTTDRLATLTAQLAEAQKERARRIEYDTVAKTISKLPDREKGKESQTKLNGDIDDLLRQEQTYAGTWVQRKEAFDHIVASLESMGEAIRDEKMEQARRQALDEDDNNAEESTLDPQAPPFEPTKRRDSADGSESGEAAEDEDGAEAEDDAGAEDGDVEMEGVEADEGQETDRSKGDREEGEMELS